MRAIDLHGSLNALGMPFALLGYVKAPPYPYGIYTDDKTVRAADAAQLRNTTDHEVIVEVYHNDPAQLAEAAGKVSGWLDSIPLSYRENMRYTPDEDHYFCSFTFAYTTKRKAGTA